LTDFLTVALVLFAIVVLAGWPWVLPAVRAMLAHVGIRFASVGVLAWDQPKADAKGMYLNFTGIEIRHRFFGTVTSQEAHVEKPIRRIIVDNV
jgi:hypothetical protein